MLPDAERRPRAKGGAPDESTAAASSVPMVTGPFCAYMYPDLTACLQPAEPASRYCLDHGEDHDEILDASNLLDSGW